MTTFMQIHPYLLQVGRAIDRLFSGYGRSTETRIKFLRVGAIFSGCYTPSRNDEKAGYQTAIIGKWHLGLESITQ